MSNGPRKVFYNSRERVISTDFNRSQNIQAQSEAERLKRQYSDVWSTAIQTGVEATAAVGGDTPLNADIFGGLLVDPSVATSLLIESGTLGAVIDDGSGDLDDSDYKIVRSEGELIAGALPFVANPGAGIMIEIVECSIVDNVVETDSRDIFDPATGLFTPQVVQKVVEKTLAFFNDNRGVQGAGIPAFTQGRLPLCIISIPASAVDYSDCIIWDVRPMVTERIDGKTRANGTGNKPGLVKGNYSGHGDGVTYPLTGQAYRQFNEYRAGGIFVDYDGTDGIDLGLAINQSGATFTTMATEERGLVVALFPSGLPRWTRYVGNEPGPANGIICLRNLGVAAAATAVITPYGKINDGQIAVPTALGLGAINAPGVFITELIGNNTAFAASIVGNDEWQYFFTVFAPVAQTDSLFYDADGGGEDAPTWSSSVIRPGLDGILLANASAVDANLSQIYTNGFAAGDGALSIGVSIILDSGATISTAAVGMTATRDNATVMTVRIGEVELPAPLNTDIDPNTALPPFNMLGAFSLNNSPLSPAQVRGFGINGIRWRF